MNAFKNTNALTALALIAGTAYAAEPGTFRVLESPVSSSSSLRCDAVTDDASSLLCSVRFDDAVSLTSSFHAFSFTDGLYSPLPGTTSPDGTFADVRVRAARLSSSSGGGSGGSSSPFSVLAQCDSPFFGSSLWSPSSNQPLHVTSDYGRYSGAFTFTATPSSRVAFGSSVADLDGDGLLDLAACSWDLSSSSPGSPPSSPTLLQMDPLSNFSVARSCSTDGRVVVGSQGHIDRNNTVDLAPDEYEQACLWSDGQLRDTSNLTSSFVSSSFFSVCDDGSTALARCVDATGKASLVAFSVSSSSFRVIGTEECDDGISMSSDGRVLGGSVLQADGTCVATLWFRQDDGSYASSSLASVLDNLGSSGQDGVSFSTIDAVSSNGLTVAGTLTLADGSVRLFTATVPTPGSLALISAGGVLAARRRRSV